MHHFNEQLQTMAKQFRNKYERSQNVLVTNMMIDLK